MRISFTSPRFFIPALFALIFGVAIGVYFAQAADGEVGSYQKISDTEGSFNATLIDGDGLGNAVAGIGDLNNDGVEDLVVGAFADSDGGTARGAVYVLFLDADGSLDATAGVSGAGWTKISDTEGSFSATIDDFDKFGTSVAGVGDLNGDGVEDIAVGAFQDSDGGDSRGAVYVLFLDTDGSLDATAGVSGAGWTKISDTEGSFNATLLDFDKFGNAVANIGDLNGDGVTDIAVGVASDNDGGADRGAVYVLFLDTDGSLDATAGVSGAGWTKISDTEGSFNATLVDYDHFGTSVAGIGDLNGDTVLDLVVGASDDAGGGSARGAVYVLFLDTDGSLDATAGVSGAGWTKISDTEGDFSATLDDGDYFGHSVVDIGDLNSDGVTDIAVGAYADGDGGTYHGAVYVVFLDTDGSVDASAGASGAGWTKISDTSGGFTATLEDFDQIGIGLGALVDINGDSNKELVIGANGDDDGGGTDRGAIYTLFLEGGDGTSPTAGGGGAITATPSFFTMDLAWTAATDNVTAAGSLVYKVYRAAAGADLDSVADIEANGTLVSTQTGGDVTYTLVDLQPNTTYTYNVIVSDEADNKTAYTQGSTATLYPSQAPTVHIERSYFNIRGDACTWDRNLILEIGGKNVSSVVVADNPQFLNATWQTFQANTTIMTNTGPVNIMEIRVQLPRAYGTYRYYALVKSATGEQSRIMLDSIELTSRANCNFPSRLRVPYFGKSDTDILAYQEAIDKAMDIEEEIEAERKAKEEANKNDPTYIENVKAGDLVKTSDSSALYYVSSELTRHAFLNEQVFSTWYSTDDMKRAKIVTATTMDRIPLKGPMPPKPGSTLIRFENDTTIYLPQIDINAKPSATPYNVTLRPITTVGLTEELFGQDYGAMILTLPESLKPQMTLGRAITKFDASLAKLKNTMKRW